MSKRGDPEALCNLADTLTSNFMVAALDRIFPLEIGENWTIFQSNCDMVHYPGTTTAGVKFLAKPSSPPAQCQLWTFDVGEGEGQQSMAKEPSILLGFRSRKTLNPCRESGLVGKLQHCERGDKCLVDLKRRMQAHMVLGNGKNWDLEALVSFGCLQASLGTSANFRVLLGDCEIVETKETEEFTAAFTAHQSRPFRSPSERFATFHANHRICIPHSRAWTLSRNPTERKRKPRPSNSSHVKG
ncbi:uncharacterized protein UDID_17552 [Ustilago sp. UG-2017a]|nr:uncharacterized protein UDID_17552 [Ustilago sp. UG-2017a]